MTRNDDKIVISVKAARINSAKTQDEAAKAIGVSLNAYKKKEKGITRFYIDEIVILSRLYGIKIENFFEAQCRKMTRSKGA